VDNAARDARLMPIVELVALTHAVIAVSMLVLRCTSCAILPIPILKTRRWKPIVHNKKSRRHWTSLNTAAEATHAESIAITTRIVGKEVLWSAVLVTSFTERKGTRHASLIALLHQLPGTTSPREVSAVTIASMIQIVKKEASIPVDHVVSMLER
jgi:hypothetical protein